MEREDLERLIERRYGIIADYPFFEDDVTCVFRHQTSNKWFAIAMRVSKRKLGLDDDTFFDIVNFKCSPEIIDSLIDTEKGVFRAYHMNKLHWITAALDGSCDDGLIEWILNVSYTLTGSKSRNRRSVGRDKTK